MSGALPGGGVPDPGASAGVQGVHHQVEAQMVHGAPDTYAPVLAPNPWWRRGAAIALMVFAAYGMFDATLSAVFTGLGGTNFGTGDNKPPELGPYPESGTSQEQSDWNGTRDAWVAYNWSENLTEDFIELTKEYRINEVRLSWQAGFLLTAVAGGLLILSGHRAGWWVALLSLVIGEAGSLHYSWLSGKITNEALSTIPSEFEVPAWLISTELIAGVTAGFATCCNAACLGVVLLCWVMSRGPNPHEPVGYAPPVAP